MISAAAIGDIIRNPELAGNYSYAELAEIRDKFSYCSTLHLICLKGLSLSNDVQFEEHLRYAAAHVFDRERMYHLIHSGANAARETESERETISEREINRQESATKASEVNERLKETPVVALKIVPKDEPLAEAEKHLEKVDTAVESTILPEKTVIPEIEKEATKSLESGKKEEADVVQEFEISKDAINRVSTNIAIDVNTEEPVPTNSAIDANKEETVVEIKPVKIAEPFVEDSIKPADKSEDSTTADEVETKKDTAPKTNILDAAPDLVELAYTEDLEAEEAIYQDQISALVEEKKNADKENLPANIQQDAEQNEPEPDLTGLSFIEWLQYKQHKKLPSGQKSSNDLKAVELPKTAKDTKIQAATDPVKSKKSSLSRSEVDALLNKFITEEPSISRPTATFFSPVKSAKQSLEEAPDLVTETLAKIYVLQKNYVKAIQAYEQLSLVYPEKKTFFATRIQKIKEEQQKQ